MTELGNLDAVTNGYCRGAVRPLKAPVQGHRDPVYRLLLPGVRRLCLEHGLRQGAPHFWDMYP